MKTPQTGSAAKIGPARGKHERNVTVADKPLFILDADSRWRLAYDSNQWVIQRRAQKPRVRRLEGHAIADSASLRSLLLICIDSAALA